MKLSIIVPAFNEEKLLAASLQSIKAAAGVLHQRGWQTELVVCDNNSTDRTSEIAAQEGAKVVFEPINQISRARNCGAGGATGDWFLFVDADSHPSPQLFLDLAETLESGKVLGGGCLVTMEIPKDSRTRGARALIRLWNGLSRWQRWAAGSFVFCEAATFRELGGFSTELFASEEVEFSNRLKKLARQRGLQLTILHKHPLETSARKLHLYSTWEHFRFLAGTVLKLGRPLRNREACPIWYDGRR